MRAEIPEHQLEVGKTYLVWFDASLLAYDMKPDVYIGKFTGTKTRKYVAGVGYGVTEDPFVHFTISYSNGSQIEEQWWRADGDATYVLLEGETE